MSSFPLLNLPSIPLEQVLLQFPVAETIYFSLCSKNCKRIVKSIRYPFTAIDIRINLFKSLYLKVGEKRYFTWSFWLKPLPKNQRIDPNELRKICGTEIRVKRTKNKDGLESPRTPEHYIKVVYDYLQELFNLPNSRFDFENDKNRKQLPHGFGIKKCEVMNISTEKPIEHEHIQYIFENVEVSNLLSLNIPHFQTDSPPKFSMEELYIWNSQWITRDTFLSLDCARIQLNRISLQTKDYEDFISQWFNSTDTRLEYIKMRTIDRNIKLDLSKFDAKPWDPSVRGQYYELQFLNGAQRTKYNCSNGMDIIRSDGLLATIIDRLNVLYFLVWHNNRFPNCEGLNNDYY